MTANLTQTGFVLASSSFLFGSHQYTYVYILFFFVLSERAYKQKIPKYITEKVGVILQVMFCFIYSLLKIAIALRIIRYNIVGRRVQLAFMFGGHM